MKKTLETEVKRLKALETEVEQLRNQVKQLLEENGKLDGKNMQLEEKVVNLEEQVVHMKNDNTFLRKQGVDMKNDSSFLKEDNTSLRKEVQLLNYELGKLVSCDDELVLGELCWLQSEIHEGRDIAVQRGRSRKSETGLGQTETGVELSRRGYWKIDFNNGKTPVKEKSDCSPRPN